MKKLVILAILISGVCMADPPDGTGVTYLGVDSGAYMSSVDYSEVIGYGAGYNMYSAAGVGLFGVGSGRWSNYITWSTAVGYRAAESSYELTDVFAAGKYAAKDSSYLSHVVAIGYKSLYMSGSIENSVFIGSWSDDDNSISGWSDSVIIGRHSATIGEDTSDVSGRVGINDQIFVDNATDSIRINPKTYRSDSSITSSNGVLSVGYVTVGYCPTNRVFDADLYLSMSGDDSNDGLSPSRPKRTIEACIDAASLLVATGIVVSVGPGEYQAPIREMSFLPSDGVTFKSEEGKDRTFIVGGQGHIRVKENASYYVGIDGFTLVGFDGDGISPDGQHSFSRKKLRFFGADFVDCELKDSSFNTDGVLLGDFQACRFTRCHLHDLSITNGSGDRIYGAFNGVDFHDCIVEDLVLYGFGACISSSASDNTLFRMPFSAAPYAKGTGHCEFKNVTFVAPRYENPNGNPGLSSYAKPCPTNSTSVLRYDNVLFVVGGINPPMPTTHLLVMTNAEFNVDFTVNSVDSPAVRDDGYPDYGYKDTGRSAYKAIRKLISDRQEAAQ